MPIPDATYSSLQLIIQDIRELTRALSEEQISDDRIMYWINTFMLYDMPSALRLKALRTTFQFYTTPYVDVYESTFTDPNDPFYNFRNTYINTFAPFFCAGYLGGFTQSRTDFFGAYPNISAIALITYGDGTTTQFSGVINALQTTPQPSNIQQPNVCLVRNDVQFDSIDVNGNGLIMVDTPISAMIGNLSVPNNPPTSLTVQDPNNFINYVTGQFVVTFINPPASGQNINSQTVPVAPAMPQLLLWFDNKIVLRPVPDQPYKITVEANIRPTELLSSSDMPLLSEWYQYVVYGAATKIFQMRGDMDSVERIAPEFKKQELFVGRTTIVQNSKQSVPTIFNQGYGQNLGQGFGFFGSGTF